MRICLREDLPGSIGQYLETHEVNLKVKHGQFRRRVQDHRALIQQASDQA
jgi:hypothetical protein